MEIVTDWRNSFGRAASESRLFADDLRDSTFLRGLVETDDFIYPRYAWNKDRTKEYVQRDVMGKIQ